MREHDIKTAEQFGILERCKAFEADLLKIKDIVPDRSDDGIPFDLNGFLSNIYQVYQLDNPRFILCPFEGYPFGHGGFPWDICIIPAFYPKNEPRRSVLERKSTQKQLLFGTFFTFLIPLPTQNLYFLRGQRRGKNFLKKSSFRAKHSPKSADISYERS